MCKRMINRYVDKVLTYLPIRDRRKARKIITSMIYARLDDYTEGLRPLGRDVREVLRELGDPGELAYAYYAEFHRTLPELNWEALRAKVIQVVTSVALILVIIGIAGLLLGSGNMTAIVVGTLLGVGVVFYRMVVLPTGKEYTPRRYRGE